jgi:hypothetical protein
LLRASFAGSAYVGVFARATDDHLLVRPDIDDDLLADLTAPFVAVPGNHDVPKTFDDHRSASRGRFVDHYTPGSLPYHRRIGGVQPAVPGGCPGGLR